MVVWKYGYGCFSLPLPLCPDIALLLQPMLLLGISIGVTSNVVLPTWMLKLLLVALLFRTPPPLPTLPTLPLHLPTHCHDMALRDWAQ